MERNRKNWMVGFLVRHKAQIERHRIRRTSKLDYCSEIIKDITFREIRMLDSNNEILRHASKSNHSMKWEIKKEEIGKLYKWVDN